MPIDDLALRFDQNSLRALNAVLALVMFGVALDLRIADFRRVTRTPRAAVIGLLAQFVLLPAVTFLLVRLAAPPPSMALGLILVAACPGGTISNVMAHLARADTALSVTLSAMSTLGAMVMTPLNIAFWGGLDPRTARVLREVALDPMAVATTVAMVLVLPVILGMTVARHEPSLAARLVGPMRIFSIVVFLAFVALALAANFDHFLHHVSHIAGIVLVHNALALAIGYGTARLVGLGEAQRRTMSIEIGIQNSGLGLILIFGFFDGLGGMALVAAWWGVWHIVSGLTLAAFWSRRPPAAA